MQAQRGRAGASTELLRKKFPNSSVEGPLKEIFQNSTRVITSNEAKASNSNFHNNPPRNQTKLTKDLSL